MNWSDYADAFSEIFPISKPVETQTYETPTGSKDITNEIKEEVIDNPIIEKVETPPIEEKENITDGNTGNDQSNNE